MFGRIPRKLDLDVALASPEFQQETRDYSVCDSHNIVNIES